MTNRVQCQINGAEVSFEGRLDEPLLLALRNRLGLKASHFGCGLEQCGACVLSVDGQARYSCALPVSFLDGASIVTPEGLADDPVGRALLEAFDAEHAGQCGYCLSGIVMSAFALLKANRSPTREAVIEALDRHLCRCGAHGGILRAVERAAKGLAEASR
ncbi:MULTISPECIES: 2Fe-2S iron-sulfur cluster-binding protein [unclassified Ensifer]|uniref:(2Fe-2S)-binding protein n=1 Tax=unclassified Ensifer TaxID=2633371 RepID=UPI000813AC82|nr:MULTISPECIES: 2Fe-2S iron-sulfur cluster-binding protein [unclassified Ensifer]OCP20919.1 hypothetical protein BC361_28030 [Ensifer sp. LC54]OCP25474.1 hypothetical protein BC363_19885 [Ensifer sp. LC384]